MNKEPQSERVSRRAYFLSDDEALIAFEAIAVDRLWKKVECSGSFRCDCRRCAKAERWANHDEFDRVFQIAKRWASLMVRRGRELCPTMFRM